MTSERKYSRRLPSVSCDEVNISGLGSSLNSHTPSRSRRCSEKHDLEANIDENRTDGDDNNNNNRSASAYLSKLLDCKDLLNDLDASPSPGNPELEANGFTYNSLKPSTPSTSNMRSAIQRSTSLSQKRQSRIPNRHKPAEIFRKDLISAMKIPDTSQLLNEEYWIMQDPWRIEWEKGVQVPVNAKSVPTKNIQIVPKETLGDFRMPRKMLKSSPDIGDRDMIDLNVLADSTCRYDLDEMDVAWLKIINHERKMMGLATLDEFSMEQIMEELETQCHDNMQLAIKTKEGLGIEYDEDVVCDVCRIPDCEEGNEMVFCDGCNLCVHQACYGILKVPVGSWLCKPCALGIRGSAMCILCNKKGGAMKSTRSGNKWAHVSCALWIPEITIADPDRMEPITKVSHVPSSRWALLCSICKDRVGACIQCSVRHCVTAYHVTCAIEDKLDMIADCGVSPLEGQEDAVIFRSYCKKHSTNRKESDGEDEQTEERIRGMRHRRIMELEQEFYTLVKYQAVANALSIPSQTARDVMEYWKLKRAANFNRPLITPKHEEGTALAEAAETNLQRRLRMFTHLRQDLERVRNLCYMIGRREKTKRATVKNMESVFLTQMKYLERCMSRDGKFEPQRMLKTLPKFGQPEVCELARKESVLLAKTPEWNPSTEKNQRLMPEEKLNNKIEKAAQQQEKTPVKLAEVGETSKQKLVRSPVNSSLRHKNGLHRKAFLTACRKHESLSPRKTLPNKTDVKDEVEEKVERVDNRRKRSMRSSDTDSESQSSKPPVKKSQRAKAWTTWRATGAAASPSAFTIKTEKETNGKEENIVVGKTSKNLPSPRASVGGDASPVIAETKPREAAGRVTRQSRLVVKWDSDKTDDPEIVQKTSDDIKQHKTINLRTNKSRIVSSECSSESGKNKEVAASRPAACSRTITRSSKSRDSVDNNHNDTPTSRPPLRQSALKAKNDSGALALSCDEEAGQELLKPAEDDQENIQVGGAEKRDDEKDEEDVGYRGDMDESDTELTRTPCGRHKQSHTGHKRPHRLNVKTTDTADSSDYSSRSRILSKTFPSKRKRLKSMQNRTRTDLIKTGVLFKGFKDPIEGVPRARTRSQTDTSDSNRPKNSGAVDDICDRLAHESEHNVTTIVGGHSGNLIVPASSSSVSHPPPAHVKQEFHPPGLDNFHNPLQTKGFYPTFMPPQPYHYMNPQDIYYTSIAQYQSHPMWSILTEEQKMKLTQQLSKSLFPTNYYHEPAPNHKSPIQPMPDSTLSPESQPVLPPAMQMPENVDPQPAIPTLPSACESLPHPSPAIPLNPEPSTQATAHENYPENPTKKNKKKKKKKSKKKKKKRKRQSSDSYYSSSSFNSDGSYGEFCVEYCSTLDPALQTNNENRADDHEEISVPTDTTIPQVPVPLTAENVPQPSEEPFVTEIPNKIKPLEQIETTSTPPPPDPGTSKLLLKIDKKRIVLSQDSDNCDSAEEIKSSSDSSIISEKDSEPSDKEGEEKLIVSPLKLKLSATKSDRTLRNGLMPCEYQILEGKIEENILLKSPVKSEPTVSKTPAQPTPQPVTVNQLSWTSSVPQKVETGAVKRQSSGHVALRRLGLPSQTVESSEVPEKRTLRNRNQPNKAETSTTANKKAPKQEQKRPSLASVTPMTTEKRKRGRPKKNPNSTTSKTTKPNTAASNANIDAYISISQHMSDTSSTTTCSSNVQDRLGPLLGKNDEQRSKSFSSDSSKHSSIHPSLQPERHWKKRKVREHETSVTKPLPTSPEDILPSPPLSSEIQTQNPDFLVENSKDNSTVEPTTNAAIPNALSEKETESTSIKLNTSSAKLPSLRNTPSPTPNKFNTSGVHHTKSSSLSQPSTQVVHLGKKEIKNPVKPESKISSDISESSKPSSVDVYEFADFGS